MINRKIVTVCIHWRANPNVPSCARRGGVVIADQLEKEIAARRLPVHLERFECLGQCDRGPNVKLSPGGEFCHGVDVEDIPGLLDRIELFADS